MLWKQKAHLCCSWIYPGVSQIDDEPPKCNILVIILKVSVGCFDFASI